MKTILILGLTLGALQTARAEMGFTHNALNCTTTPGASFELTLNANQWSIHQGSDVGTLVVQEGTGIAHARNQEVYSIDGWGDGDTDFFFLVGPKHLSPGKSAKVTLVEQSDNGNTRTDYECRPLE
jgi:hypothetical protein